jgi:ureidoacrylate peracid hydrolase
MAAQIGGSMASMTYEKNITAPIVIDPYNDFIAEGGKIWGRIKNVAEANNCVLHMPEVLNASRKAELRVFYSLHQRYGQGDYETWKYIAPILSSLSSSHTPAWRPRFVMQPNLATTSR